MALVRSAHPEASSSSSNASSSTYTYDVFLSFRGEDTRKTFTDHLYAAFINAGVRTFRDDNELQRGEYIKPELEKAIKQSRSSVVVFSKDYASSTWCLDELLMIMEQNRTADHKVLPVFYDVDPSHVRKQTGSLEKAFARHKRNQFWKDKVKRWRAALTEAADLAGMVLADGHESEFIKKVVKVIEDKLRRMPLGVDEHLIGIDSQVEEINFWLEDGSTDVFILLIYGMRGIGKSTIAKVVYNQNKRRFERCSFLEDVREVSKQPNGLVSLQNQLLNDILTGKEVKMQGVSEGIAKIEETVSSRRVFLVLDDVDHVEHLDALLRMQNRHQGSKVIITTSCAGLVEAHRKFVTVHEVKTLGYSQSLEFFSWHAFGQNDPVESYMDLSRRIVNHCGGIPLALKVLGSSLSGKTVAFWESASNKLEVIPNGEIMKKLKLSYESLQDDHDRNLFLHIACFFIGMEKDFIVTILDDWDFFPEVGIQNLIDRCLVTIGHHNKVQMHNLIRDMGRDIVRLESKEPRKRSRIWHHMDSVKVLTENNGTEAIEGIVANMQLHPTYTSSRNSSKVVLEANAFTRMCNLRFLQLSHVQCSGCFEGFPAGLRWLSWSKYPLACLPNDFPSESVVALDMCYSSLRRVWKGTKHLPKLKILDLSHSLGLVTCPDLSGLSNLERLVLEGCKNITKIDESIGDLEKLVLLNLQNCKNLVKLPETIYRLRSIQEINLSGCSSLALHANTATVTKNFFSLLSDASLQSIWSRVSPRSSVEPPGFSLVNLPRCLVRLNMSCCNLSEISIDLSILSSLKELDLSYNPFMSLPENMKSLMLNSLRLNGCRNLLMLPELPPSLNGLQATQCVSLKKVTNLPNVFTKLFFDFTGCEKLVEVHTIFIIKPLINQLDLEMIRNMGLCNPEPFQRTEKLEMENYFTSCTMTCPLQGLYEFGIFSIFLRGRKIPDWYNYRGENALSIIVPSHPKLKVKGLNVCVVYTSVRSGRRNRSLFLKVSNEVQGIIWSYTPVIIGVPKENEEMSWLSHWQFENDELKAGEEVRISVDDDDWYLMKELAVQLVYEFGNEGKAYNGIQLSSPEDVKTQHKAAYWSQGVLIGNVSPPDFQICPGAYELYNLHLFHPQIHFSDPGLPQNIYRHQDFEKRVLRQQNLS